jgi:hypothetical protein
MRRIGTIGLGFIIALLIGAGIPYAFQLPPIWSFLWGLGSGIICLVGSLLIADAASST